MSQVLTFYFVMPVMLGFIVQSYMAAQLPGADPTNRPALGATSRAAGGAGDPLSCSMRSQSHADGGGGERPGGGGGRGGGGGEVDPLSSSRRSYRDGAVAGFGVGTGAGAGASAGAVDPFSAGRRSRSGGKEGAAVSAAEGTSLLGSTSGKGGFR